MAHDHHHHDCQDHDHDHHHHDDEDVFDPELTFGPAPFVAPVQLQAGPVSVWFDPEWGFLRRISCGTHELVRAIYGAVRSDKWATARPRLENLHLDQQPDHFLVRFDAICRDDSLGIDFSWKGTLTGTRDGVITYELDGTAAHPFKSNRTGLCLLHPGATCAGRSVTIEHTDGGQTTSTFPTLISPHQPFFHIRSLQHPIDEKSTLQLTFSGDDFEMEDQRNWSDASFKTYSGSLAVPIPHSFPAGHRVQQSITIEILGTAPAASKNETDLPVILTLPKEPSGLMPYLGTRWAPEADPLSGSALEEAQLCGWDHLLVELNLAEPTWKDELTRAIVAADAVEALVLLRLTLTANHAPAFAQLTKLIPSEKVTGLILLEAGQPCTPAAFIQHILCGHDEWINEIPVAAAPPLNFADMNRYRPGPDTQAAMPLCPQVHTFDHQSVMENLESQPAMIETIQSFNDHPIWITPIALLRRRVADPRQASLFAAAYTVGTLAQLATHPDVELMTFYEHAGKNGILSTPVGDVFACLASATQLAPVASSAPDKVRALALFDDENTRALMLANMTFENILVTLHDPNSNPDEALTLELGPYAFATIEV